jgi:hypothetical protein
MNDERTIVRCTTPFAIIRNEEATVLKGQMQLDIGPMDVHVSITQVKRGNTPPHLKAIGVGLEVQGSGDMEIGSDPHGAFSYSEVEVTIHGNASCEPDVKGKIVQMLNSIAKMKAVECADFTVPLLTQRDIFAFDSGTFKGDKRIHASYSMSCGNLALEELTAKHVCMHSLFLAYVRSSLDSGWADEAYEAYAELTLERAVPALSHISIAFELFINSAIYELTGDFPEQALYCKCTKVLAKRLGGSLENQSIHGDNAILFTHVLGLRNSVLHKGIYEYDVSTPPGSGNRVHVKLDSWSAVVAHFDRVAALVEYIAGRLSLTRWTTSPPDPPIRPVCRALRFSARGPGVAYVSKDLQ